jgi:hypothetical protein
MYVALQQIPKNAFPYTFKLATSARANPRRHQCHLRISSIHQSLSYPFAVHLFLSPSRYCRVDEPALRHSREHHEFNTSAPALADLHDEVHGVVDLKGLAHT